MWHSQFIYREKEMENFSNSSFSSSPSSPSSSSSSSKPWKKYDVFLSFRGEDTRLTFTGHLYDALTQKGLLYTFKDEEKLKKGKYIAQELMEAIENSRFAIVVLSENYASSTWCLREISKIVECMGGSDSGRILPIFYHVDPSHVRKQIGSYEDAFKKHEQNRHLNFQEVPNWRDALKKVGNIKGWHVQDKITDEAKFIREFMEDVRINVGPGLIKRLEGLFGMDSRLKEFDSCVLNKKTRRDVHFIGIYGVGGIGKTTLARAYYKWMSDKFNGNSCFLEDVREESEKKGLEHLQKKLLKQILREEREIMDVESGKEMIKNALWDKKVLIVLDDVNKPKELQALADNAKWFGGGSVIIITTRNESLLKKTYKEITMYKAKQLSNRDALRLFSWKAFKSSEPFEDYKELSKEAITFAKNIPLALEVLGSHLYGKTIDGWRSVLDTLKEYPTKESIVDGIIQISFDALEEPVKEILLDIACFFNGCEKEYVIQFLDSHGFSPKNGIKLLKDKSLLSTQHGNGLWMHDLVQKMGKKFIRTKSENQIERQSRIWNEEDLRHILENETGTDEVKAIVTSLEGSTKLSFEAVSHMKNLRLLMICTSCPSKSVDPTQNLEFLSNELQLLQWDGFPYKHFPSRFRPKGLVQLKLIDSKIEKLWNDHSKTLNNLKIIDLSCSRNFSEFEDFSVVPSLERLNLEGCTKLSKIDPSVTVLKKLIELNLKDCTSLEEFPKSIKGLNSLKTLNLYGCLKLCKLPEDFGDLQNLIVLDVRKSGMIHLPSSIFHIEKLQTLSCSDEVAKSTLRENIMNPTSVKCFLPRSFCSLKELDLSDCELSDEAFPEYFGGLASLEKLNLSRNPFYVLPQSIKKLSNLTHLNLEHCENLTHLGLELPSTLENVILNHCTSLNSFLDSIFKPCHLQCVDCFKLVQKQGSQRTVLASLQRYFQEPTNRSRNFDIILPGSEIPAWFKTKSSMPSISIETDANWYKNEKWIGFAMSVSLHANSSAGDNFKYVVRCCSKVAKSCRIMHSIRRIKSRSRDHLWLFYLHRDSIHSEWLHKTRGNLEFSFSAYNGNVEDKSCCGPCGLRLVYDNDIEELNQISNNFNGSDPSREDLHSPPSIRVENMINPAVGKVVFSGHDPSSLTKLDLSSSNLTDEPFPEDFGCLVSLEDLNLSNNPFNVLPPSVKNLSKLKYLNLEYCTTLKCLGPELPSSLETILVNYCTSLDSFLDPLNPCHLQCSAFCVDCSELVKRQDSTKTALTSLKRYLQKSPDGSLRFDIVLPGSKIPEWFSHLDGGGSIKTKLFPNWCTSEWMGFAAFVLFPAKPSSYDLFCHIQAFGYDFEATPKHFTNMGSSDDHHLWLFYLSRDYFPKEWLQNKAGIVEFSFSYQSCNFVCGVRLVYKKDANNLHQYITSQ